MTDSIDDRSEKEKARERNAKIDATGANLWQRRPRSIPSGNVVDRYKMVSNRRKIVLGLLIAFMIRTLATIDTEGAKKGKPKIRKAITEQNLVAWAVLASFLAIASDIDTTSDIAVAFTLLILVAALLTSGMDAIDNLNKLISSGKTIQKSVSKTQTQE